MLDRPKEDQVPGLKNGFNFRCVDEEQWGVAYLSRFLSENSSLNIG